MSAKTFGRGERSGALDAVRSRSWINRERVLAYGSALAFIWFVMLGCLAYKRAMIGQDYASFWAASRLMLTGLAADTYIPALHQLAEIPVLPHGYSEFFYPPPYLMVCIPLALLPFYPSLIGFLCVTAALFAGVLSRIVASPLAALAVVASPFAAMNALAGQNAFLTTAIMGGGLTLLDRRPKLAGAILGLMIIKPHLALAVPVALIISRRWSTLLWAAATAVGLSVLTVALFGWDVWPAFLANSHSARDLVQDGGDRLTKMQSVFAASRILGAGVAPAYAMQAIVAVAAVGMLIWTRSRHVSAATERSLIILATLLMTPFSMFYDLLLTTLPLAWMLREWLERGFPSWGKPGLAAAFCAPAAVLIYERPVPFGVPYVLLMGLYLVWTARSGRTEGSTGVTKLPERRRGRTALR